MTAETPEVAEEAIEKHLDNLALNDDDDDDSSVRNDEKRQLARAAKFEERRKLWEEEQAKKEVLEQGVAGTVKWFSVRDRFGFIERDDGKGDIFVHQSVIAKSKFEVPRYRTLADGEHVVFDIVQGKQGPEAANVTGPDGENVKGSRFVFLLLNRQRQFKKREDAKNDSKKQDSEVKPVSDKKKGSEKKTVSDRKAEESTPEPADDAKDAGDKKPQKRKRNRKAVRKAAEARKIEEEQPEKEPVSGQRRKRSSETDSTEEVSEQTAIDALASGDAVCLGAATIEGTAQLSA